jgi:alpha-glucosidase
VPSSKVRAWWERGATYQLYVRSFADANGDGIGDLDGIRAHLDHVASMGVDAIWLNPCYPSPQVDHGYDIADYFDIEPAYGDLSAFDALVAAAHDRGIRVLMDVVPNHCSSQHPLFAAALAAGPASVERGQFYFRPGRGVHGEEPPNNWLAHFGGSAWTRVTERTGEPGEWYLAVFTPDQPDLNFDHPDVGAHFDDVLRFWLDRGVDGFRADAVTMVGKAPGLPDWSPADPAVWEANPQFTWQPSGHLVWRRWRSLIDQYEADHPGREILLVAEAYTPERPDLLLAYANPGEFHQSFAFDLMLAPWRPDVMKRVIESNVRALVEVGLLPAWTLNNHDTQRTTTRFGRADAAIHTDLAPGAIVNNLAPVDLILGLRRARAAALLMLALPGAVYLYAGEELGLPEVLDLPDDARQDPVFHNSNGEQYGRDGCRIPLPWTRSVEGSFGFSPNGRAAPPWLPQPEWWGSWAVEAENDDPSSTLAMYRAALALRRNEPGLRSDGLEWIEELSGNVVAFRREEVIVILNPSDHATTVAATLVGGRRILLSSVHRHVDPHLVPANTTVWLA